MKAITPAFYERRIEQEQWSISGDEVGRNSGAPIHPTYGRNNCIHFSEENLTENHSSYCVTVPHPIRKNSDDSSMKTPPRKTVGD